MPQEGYFKQENTFLKSKINFNNLFNKDDKSKSINKPD